MRKLFRFKYEPCNKTCYAYCSKLMVELRAMPENRRHNLVTTMVEAHNKLCDNPQYSFGVDVDEDNGIFVAHFRTPATTDLFSNRDFAETVEQVCKVVLETDIPQVGGDCNFGDNGGEDLGHEILKFCTDVEFAQISESHCQCKAHAG